MLALLGDERPQERSAFMTGMQTAGDPGSSPRSSGDLTEMEKSRRMDERIESGDELDGKISAGWQRAMAPELEFGVDTARPR